MKIISFLLVSYLITFACVAKENKIHFDYDTFVEKYFSSWTESQKPDATKENIDQYLSLLADDVAHQHIPYDMTDKREPNGKQVIRDGMLHWLGANTKYRAKLISFTTGYNVVVIKYKEISQGVSNGNVINIVRDNIEVLELENGKVTVIRKYGK
ncbi:MAG: hypothetical protein ACI9YH_005084 [Colwellia sp.]|jgi:hypothetical protein